MKSLPSFLLGGDTLPSTQIIRDNNLAPYAYVTTPKQHQHKDLFRPAYLRSLQRHYALKKDMKKILDAWILQGIEVMLLKGFYFSEFIYPAPGMRFHADVDVAIHPKDEQKAYDIAREQGWDIVKELNRSSGGACHEAFVIFSEKGSTYMEVHRFLFHSRVQSLPHKKQRKVSKEIWKKAGSRAWEDITVKIPEPVDTAIILALQRFWGEPFLIKPHDPLDLRFLIREKGVTKEALLERASKLRCKGTVNAFLERCNPWDDHLQLSSPSIVQQIKWSLQILPERGLVLYETKFLRLLRAPAALMDVLHVLPTVIKVRLTQRRHTDPSKLAAELTPDPKQKNSSGQEYPEHRLVRGIRWALRFLRLSSPGPCLLRSLSLYRLLRKQGKPATFVCGLRKVEGKVSGHAWVELNGKVLPALNEPHNRRHFNVSLEYPQTVQ